MELFKKKMRDSGIKLVIEQEDMNDIMTIIEALENSGILLKGVSKTIENETKEQREGFFSMLLGTLGLVNRRKRNSKSRRRSSKSR